MFDFSCLNIALFPGSTCTLETDGYYITDNLGISEIKGGSFLITPSLKSYKIEDCTKKNGTVVEMVSRIAQQDNQGYYIFTISIDGKYLSWNGLNVTTKEIYYLPESIITDNEKWTVRKSRDGRWFISPSTMPNTFLTYENGMVLTQIPSDFKLTNVEKTAKYSVTNEPINNLSEKTKSINIFQYSKIPKGTDVPNYTTNVPGIYTPTAPPKPPMSSSQPPPESSSQPPPESSSQPPPESSSQPPPESSSQPPVPSNSEDIPEGSSDVPPSESSSQQPEDVPKEYPKQENIDPRRFKSIYCIWDYSWSFIDYYWYHYFFIMVNW